MPSDLPAWADAELSAELPLIAAGGERQDLDFKERLPDQLRDLAKEIAAFATSNTGRIVLGISDEGVVTGLLECAAPDGRASLVSRVEGICKNVVTPPITPEVKFGISDTKVVASVLVPKGASPVYYVGNIPYVRQLTAARPAQPQEMIDLIVAWDAQRKVVEGRVENFLEWVRLDSQTALLRCFDYGDERTGRWLASAARSLGESAEKLHMLAIEVPPGYEDAQRRLKEIASDMDVAAHQEVGPANLDQSIAVAAIARAIANINELRSQCLPTRARSQASIERMRISFRAQALKLETLTRVAQNDAQREGSGILGSDPSGIGWEVRWLVVSYRTLLGDTLAEELDSVGRRLRLVPLRLDRFGDKKNREAVANEIADLCRRLNELAATVDSAG